MISVTIHRSVFRIERRRFFRQKAGLVTLLSEMTSSRNTAQWVPTLFRVGAAVLALGLTVHGSASLSESLPDKTDFIVALGELKRGHEKLEGVSVKTDQVIAMNEA